jgi:choline dehydrogenase-like flavoprotein
MESHASTTQITSADHSRSIAERAAELVPYRSAAETISAEDLAIPRMYVGQPTSSAVQDGLVPPGSLFVASDALDSEPTMLYKAGDTTGPLIHPIGLRKGWAFTDENGDFQIADYLAAEVAEDAQLAYTFALLVPEFDTELPVSMMLKSTARQTAKKICLQIKRAEPAPPWSVAFRLTTAARQNDRGRWHVPQAASAEADRKRVEQAGALAAMLGIGIVEIRATDTSGPVVDGKPVSDDDSVGF